MPAVNAIASAPQKVTRAVAFSTLAPPALAPIAPSSKLEQRLRNRSPCLLRGRLVRGLCMGSSGQASRQRSDRHAGCRQCGRADSVAAGHPVSPCRSGPGAGGDLIVVIVRPGGGQRRGQHKCGDPQSGQAHQHDSHRRGLSHAEAVKPLSIIVSRQQGTRLYQGPPRPMVVAQRRS